MSDPRLLQWLEAGRRALALDPHDRVAGLQELAAERAELVRSLAENPPRLPASAGLARELAQLETELASAAIDCRHELAQRIAALRAARRAANGYLPASLDVPAFVSRSV